MSDRILLSSGHHPGYTTLAFDRDGSHVYTGGSDSIVRIWRTDRGTDQEPETATASKNAITSLAAGNDFWLSASTSEDSLVRRYTKGNDTLEGLVLSAAAIPIRCVAINPKGTRAAVTSDELEVKIVDLHDITKVSVLKGHKKGVRKATWHPSGALLTTCGQDGKIIVWDVSEDEPKEITTIEGIIPTISNLESEEMEHDCSAIWHNSGQHFYVATRTNELISISRATWTKASTFSDPTPSGPITALSLSPNGSYIASAHKSGLYIWSTQNRRLLFQYQSAIKSPITVLSFSPTQNLLAWVDTDGDFTRWLEPIPQGSPDPVKSSGGTSATMVQKKRSKTPDLFGDIGKVNDDDKGESTSKGADDTENDLDMDEGVGGDNDIDGLDDWILDDLGGGILDDDSEKKRWTAKEGVREMVSVTKAQPPFQPGSTPFESKKRYLAYNMIGVIESTDQDTHNIINVHFHDQSSRRNYHFTDHFKYSLASLGERGAVYASQPDGATSTPAQVLYRPTSSSTFSSAHEWSYSLPPNVRVLGVACSGPPPPKRGKGKVEEDILGNGNVVLATSEGELIFLTAGGGIERCVLSLWGDFVAMVASPEWVFIVTRDGSTSMDGSQNLTGRLIKFEDFGLIQKDSLPIRKGQTLQWIGVSEEGAPVMYDSAGVLHALPRFRLPFQATWTRLLDTNTLDRREGKDESYWPVGVNGQTFMCLILKGRQKYPGFPRPFMQDLPLRLPFKRTDPKESPLEENLARETLLLQILRDALPSSSSSSTPPEITQRYLTLDKSLIQLLQTACKSDKLARAIDLVRMLNNVESFEMAKKVAGFYHLIGLQEKIEWIKEERVKDLEDEEEDQGDNKWKGFERVPAPNYTRAQRNGFDESNSKPKPFQDFRPPPVIHRPGLERATPQPSGSSSAGPSSFKPVQSTPTPPPQNEDNGDLDVEYVASPDGKRKRGDDGIVGNGKKRMTTVASNGVTSGFGESISTSTPPAARTNPFARKHETTGNGPQNRNPFAKPLEAKASLHKSESFFTKVDQAETEKPQKRPTVKGKAKDAKAAGGRQTTLFGYPAGPPTKGKGKEKEKEKNKGKEKEKEKSEKMTAKKSETSESQETQPESQDVVMEESESQMTDTTIRAETQPLDEDVGESQGELVGGEDDNTQQEGSPEPIDWPASPVPA
ncbi:hypothetical protein ABKN59_002914 [Abortiporus biennis]